MADDLKEARDAFERCMNAEKENRITARDDIDFAMLNKQWPAEIRQQREIEHRPILTINKLTAFIRQVVNDSRQNKPSIYVAPVDSGADIETANILEGIIRNIEAISSADVAYDTAVEQAVSSGFGYWRIKLDYATDDAFDTDIMIERIANQFSVYGDPNSTAADSSDWDVCFVTDRIPKKVYEKRYGEDRGGIDWDSESWTSLNTNWLNDDSVTIAEWWRRYDVDREVALLTDGRVFPVEDLETNDALATALAEGVIKVEKTRTVRSKRVTQTIISGAEVLEEEKEFPCRYIPVVPVYGNEIIVEGKRYFRSLIHNAKDAQMMFNFWRTAATELVALAPRVPFIGHETAFSADPNWATANARSHAFLMVADGQQYPQRQPLDGGVAAGALQEALNASDDIKAIVGMYDASLGARSNETSGRAIMARKAEGDVATFHFIDNLTRAIKHTGRILIDMIPRVYSGAKVMRVLGEDGKAKNVPVNQQYMRDENGGPIMDANGKPVNDSENTELQSAIIAMHDLATGKYDVVVKSGPSFTTRREEAAYQMQEMIRAFPASAPVIGPAMARNLDWPQADDIAEKLEKMVGGEQPEIPPELQQAIEQGQAQIQQLQTENEQLKSDQGIKQAGVQIDAAKVRVDETKAQADMLRAQADLMNAQTEKERLEWEKIQAQAAFLAETQGQMPVM